MKKKFLFITLSNIGDAIMTTPVLEYVHKKNPNFLVDIVCDRKSIEVFENCPYVDRIYLKEKAKGILGVFKLIKNLRKNNYEIAIDLRTDFMLFFIKSKKKFFKLKNLKLHSVEKHFLSIRQDLRLIPELKLWIPKKNMTKVKNIIGPSKKRILALGVGANSEHKIWPIENYLKLINFLKNKLDFIVLLGNKFDKPAADIFMEKSNVNSINLCGTLNLMESAAFIKASDYFIGSDSGLGHIAAAVKTESFTLFAKEDPNRYRPWSKHARWYQHHEKNIKLITPEEVFNKIENFIN